MRPAQLDESTVGKEAQRAALSAVASSSARGPTFDKAIVAHSLATTPQNKPNRLMVSTVLSSERCQALEDEAYQALERLEEGSQPLPAALGRMLPIALAEVLLEVGGRSVSLAHYCVIRILAEIFASASPRLQLLAGFVDASQAVRSVVYAMEAFPDSYELQADACCLLRRLVGAAEDHATERVRLEVVGSNAIPAAVRALAAHTTAATMVVEALEVLHEVSKGSVRCERAVGDARANGKSTIDAVIATLEAQQDNVSVISSACSVLANVACSELDLILEALRANAAGFAAYALRLGRSPSASPSSEKAEMCTMACLLIRNLANAGPRTGPTGIRQRVTASTWKEVEEQLQKADCVQQMTLAMLCHPDEERLQEQAVMAMCNIVMNAQHAVGLPLRGVGHSWKEALSQGDVLLATLGAMSRFRTNQGLQKFGPVVLSLRHG